MPTASCLTRRQFGLLLSGLAARLGWSQTRGPWSEPAVVKKIYLASQLITWPRPDLNVPQVMAEIEQQMADLERKHPGAVRFTPAELVRTPEQAEECLKALGEVDAVLLIDLTSGTSPILRVLEKIQLPVLLFARPYSGWSYVDVARWAQAGKRADLISTSEFGDLDPYMRIFYTIHHLKHSKVLVVVEKPPERNPTAEGFTKQYGTTIRYVSYRELDEAFQKASVAEARKAADEFIRGALRVVEPTRQEIEDSLRFYLGVQEVLRRERANAITVDCLGGFRRGDLKAYPCVAWAKLNDAGLYGVCEADLLSTMTQLLLTAFSNKPGFVSDPVFDTSRNEIIHAHCVSATALQGVGGPSSPYIVRSHMEDNKGVSMQVLVPLGETVTCGKFLSPTRFAVSTGEVVGNVDAPHGCRTKFRTRVADAEKFLRNFSGGLHRVVVWGDYVKPVEQMGRLMGFQVVREC
ncbi:MAG: hypothetical protein RMI94_06710 [Bryobacterales bacterium]|nr:hypothetical protein [Bryobacteraceae bacterium]MDW8130223.1 hypothetical protein [Bryobacterales bacterium]